MNGWPLSTDFGTRLATTLVNSGRLCVGIDPHPYLLAKWGLPDSADGVRELSLRVVEATRGRAGVIKPQVAFFERHGSAGYAALEEVFAAARAAELLVIADAKRGDVGTSVEAYGQAWLTPGSPLEADAMTVSAYQGVGSLSAVFELAHAEGKGIFVLAATSNPEAREVQQALTATGRSVAASIANEVVTWNREVTGSSDTLGSAGLVLGATIAFRDFGIDTSEMIGTPVLAPGFGHQGARIEDLAAVFGAVAPSVLVNASRSILDAGAGGVAGAIDSHAAAINAAA